MLLREFIRQELLSLLEGYVPRHGLEVVDYRQLMSDETAAREEKRDAEIEAMRFERERQEGRPVPPKEIIDEPTGYVVGHKDASGRIVRPDNWAEIQRKIKDSR